MFRKKPRVELPEYAPMVKRALDAVFDYQDVGQEFLYLAEASEDDRWRTDNAAAVAMWEEAMHKSSSSMRQPLEAIQVLSNHLPEGGNVQDFHASVTQYLKDQYSEFDNRNVRIAMSILESDPRKIQCSSRDAERARGAAEKSRERLRETIRRMAAADPMILKAVGLDQRSLMALDLDDLIEQYEAAEAHLAEVTQAAREFLAREATSGPEAKPWKERRTTKPYPEYRPQHWGRLSYHDDGPKDNCVLHLPEEAVGNVFPDDFVLVNDKWRRVVKVDLSQDSPYLWIEPRELVQPTENHKVEEAPDSVLLRFAAYLRIRTLEGQAESSVPPELQQVATLARQMDELARTPDQWTRLSQAELRLFAFDRILRYAFSNGVDLAHDSRNTDLILNLFQVLARQLSVADRRLLLADVCGVLSSTEREVNGLFAFIYADPDSDIIAAASAEMAALSPAQPDDAVSGARSVINSTLRIGDQYELMRASMCKGVLGLGDWRLVPELNGCWARFGQLGKSILAGTAPELCTAALVSFCLRWLESVDEEGFGYAAGALARIPGHLGNAPVLDIMRRFPLAPDRSRINGAPPPPSEIVSGWSVAEYGRIIEPHLRLFLLNESHDPVIPLVMDAWQITVGRQEQDYQISTAMSAYMTRIRLLRSSVGKVADDTSADAQAALSIAQSFKKHPATEALRSCTAQSALMLGFADKLRLEGGTLASAPESVDALAKAERYREKGLAMRRLLTRYLGADLDLAVRTLTTISGAGMDYLFDSDFHST